ncbi:kinase-like domain-containing protein [Daedaleopsis nitida]|nr:kinase-like domain-containing protein [Daedaleopsis nitida]
MPFTHKDNRRYKLFGELGSGSYGVVYCATDLAAPANDPTGGACAVKFVSKAGQKKSTLESFRREMALHLRASEHPNIVTLRNTYETPKHCILVMDWHRGGDLRRYLCENGPYVEEAKLRSAFLSLLDAVQFLHAQGIYHRDLKPGNVLVNRDGSQLFLADFGLASDENTYTNNCGTRSYVPPEMNHEQFGERLGSRTDIWGLGLILVNMISGQMPWLHATRYNDTYCAFLADADFFLYSTPISKGANKILRRMLRENPRIRASAPDIRKAVDRLETFFRPGAAGSAPGLASHMEWLGESLEGMRSTIASELALEDQRVLEAPNSANTNTSSQNGSGSSTAAGASDCVAVAEVQIQAKRNVKTRVKALISRMGRT